MSRLRHLSGLDGMRAIGATMIVVLHSTYQIIPGLFLGVDLFFVISGFLITRILIEDQTADQFSWTGFYRRRALRLLPALILAQMLCVAIGWVSQVETPSPLGFVAINLFVANMVPPWNLGSLSTAWSLAVEEQFYFLWPFAVIFALRRANPRLLLGFAVGAIAFSVLARWVGLATDVDRETIYRFTPFRLDGLAIGCVIAIAWTYWPDVIDRVFQRLREIAYPLVVAVLLVPALLMGPKTTFMLTVGIVAYSAAFGGLVLYYAKGGGLFSSLLNHPILTFVGRRSYGLYIYHLPIVLALEPLRVADDHVNLIWVTLLKLTVSIAVAHVSYVVMERPIMGIQFKKPVTVQT